MSIGPKHLNPLTPTEASAKSGTPKSAPLSEPRNQAIAAADFLRQFHAPENHGKTLKQFLAERAEWLLADHWQEFNRWTPETARRRVGGTFGT